jgi:transcriptional regulator with XRE-family HTH domain
MPLREGASVNLNLRQALAAARLHPSDVAARLAVDPKTVDRWLAGRTPYPRHRLALADLLGVDEADLWPDATSPAVPRGTRDEFKALYPQRWAVPQELWRRHFRKAEHEIGILIYSGLFLAEDTAITHTLRQKAAQGVTVRILLGDPDSPHLAQRGHDEGVGADVMTARARNAIALYRPLNGLDNIEIRLHRTVLYNSIYRADNELLINLHTYGTPAANAPVLHLRKTTDTDIAAVYLGSFERIWTTATPLD